MLFETLLITYAFQSNLGNFKGFLFFSLFSFFVLSLSIWTVQIWSISITTESCNGQLWMCTVTKANIVDYTVLGAFKWDKMVFASRDLKGKLWINETIGNMRINCVKNTKEWFRTLRFYSHHLPPMNWMVLSTFLLPIPPAACVKWEH